MEIRREFICRVPATLVKDPALLPLAKPLYLVLAAHADGHTGRAYLSLARLENLLGCGRGLREEAQRQLVDHGWLRLERKPTGRAAGALACLSCILLLPSPVLVLTAVVRTSSSSIPTVKSVRQRPKPLTDKEASRHVRLHRQT